MKISLATLKLHNFRGYTDIDISFDSNMNVLIGKNDVGKSTILEALEIFFNNEQIKIDTLDKNINSTDDIIAITCEFNIEDDAEIIIDSSVKINLKDEYLLNKNSRLEIKKVWDCSKSTITSKDLKIYIVANYPKLFKSPLVNAKINDLKKILAENLNTSQYNTIDKSKSSSIRIALYKTLLSKDTPFETICIDTSQEDAKNIWQTLNTCLPLYFLFKSDRQNSDKDSEIQSPMKAITKVAVSTMENEFQSIKNKVNDMVKQIGEDTIKKLAELDPNIASTLSPHLTTKPIESLFSFDLISDDGIPLNKRGSGIRRLIVLSYFRAEAERTLYNKHNDSIIYAIEEPETSQHPDFQRMIMDTLISLSKDNHHQLIITTHTPEIAKLVNLNQLIFLYKDINNQTNIENDNDNKYKHIVSELGILPFAVYKTIICVEGKNDVNFIKNICKIPEFNSLIDLEKENIEILPLDGHNLVSWVNENYLKKSNIKEVHLYDNDVIEYKNKAELIIKTNDGRRFAHITNFYEMENYIPPKYIEEEFDIDLKDYYSNWDTTDVPKLICSLKPNLKESDIKKILNGKLTKKITTDDLKDINAFDEIYDFFTIVNKVSKS